MDRLPLLDDLVVQIFVRPPVLPLTVPRGRDGDHVLVDVALGDLKLDSEVVGLQLAGAARLGRAGELAIQPRLWRVELGLLLGSQHGGEGEVGVGVEAGGGYEAWNWRSFFRLNF